MTPPGLRETFLHAENILAATNVDELASEENFAMNIGAIIINLSQLLYNRSRIGNFVRLCSRRRRRELFE